MILESALLVGGLELGLSGLGRNLVASPSISNSQNTPRSHVETYPEGVVKLLILDHCDEVLNYQRGKYTTSDKVET